MRSRHFFLALGMLATLAVAARAGILFGRHPKPNPAERVPQLLVTVQTDSDEDKRAGAAKELRAFDPGAFPELVPVLIEVLKHDPKAALRAEAVQTLGKLRPISQEAGMALEEAMGDAAFRVRWQARQSLLGYRISGYRSPPKSAEASPVESPNGKEAAKRLGSSKKRAPLPPVPKTGPALVPGETAPPPLADPATAAPADQPLPKGAVIPPLAPAETPNLQKPPPAKPSEEGPDLPPED